MLHVLAGIMQRQKEQVSGEPPLVKKKLVNIHDTYPREGRRVRPSRPGFRGTFKSAFTSSVLEVHEVGRAGSDGLMKICTTVNSLWKVQKMAQQPAR